MTIDRDVAQSLTGKRAVVAGGAGGFGMAIVAELLRAGAAVTLSDLSEEKCRTACDELIESCGIDAGRRQY